MIRKNVGTKTKRKETTATGNVGTGSCRNGCYPYSAIDTMEFHSCSGTEDVTVIANMEYGCVGESQHGISVVVPECGARVGDTVSATFYVPSMKLNGYYDKLQDRVEMVQP